MKNMLPANMRINFNFEHYCNGCAHFELSHYEDTMTTLVQKCPDYIINISCNNMEQCKRIYGRMKELAGVE